MLEKRLVDGAQSGVMFRAVGEGATQGAAETQALAALNGRRKHRYSLGATNSTGSRGGSALTTDTD